MKVLQVLNHFLPKTVAGTEIYVWAMSKELQSLGLDIEVVIPNYNNDQSEFTNFDNLPVYKYAETSIVDRALIMGCKEPDGLEKFTNYLLLQKPDIVHFHDITASNGITLHHVKAAKSLGAKVFFTFHLAGYSCKTGSLLYKENIQCDGKIEIGKCGRCYLHSKGYDNMGWILNVASQFLFALKINSTKWMNKIGTALGNAYLINKQKNDFNFLINNCDKVITLTKWYKEILLLNDVAQQKIILIEQGLPQNINVEKDVKINKVENRLRLIFVGRLSYFKGLHLLIDALMQLPKDLVLLDIYGQNDGTDYEQILKEKSKLFTNITWCGAIEQREIVSLMKQYDVLCLCSTFSEMSPLVIQEAFAAGIPVLASNVYGNAEQIIPNENGWLFKFKNVVDLKIKLQQLLNNPTLLVSAKRNKTEVRNFSTIAKQHLEVYLSAIPNE